MNRPSKHAAPHLPRGTGTPAPASSAGTLGFLLSKQGPAMGVGRGIIDGESFCPLFASLSWLFPRGLWSCFMVLYEVHNAFAI